MEGRNRGRAHRRGARGDCLRRFAERVAPGKAPKTISASASAVGTSPVSSFHSTRPSPLALSKAQTEGTPASSTSRSCASSMPSSVSMLTCPSFTSRPCFVANACHVCAKLWQVPHMGDMISTTHSSSASSVRWKLPMCRGSPEATTARGSASSATSATSARGIQRRAIGGRGVHDEALVRAEVMTDRWFFAGRDERRRTQTEI